MAAEWKLKAEEANANARVLNEQGLNESEDFEKTEAAIKLEEESKRMFEEQNRLLEEKRKQLLDMQEEQKKV